MNIIDQLPIILELCKWKSFLTLTSLLDVQYKVQDVYTSTNFCLSIVHCLSSICLWALAKTAVKWPKIIRFSIFKCRVECRGSKKSFQMAKNDQVLDFQVSMELSH